MQSQKTRPIAVLISDVHYSLATLQLADAAMRQAIFKANELDVPLIVAGDLHDTKANLRGECVNAMLFTLRHCKQQPWILVGNHDKINEKSTEHSLNFLASVARIVDTTCAVTSTPNVVAIPYCNTSEIFKQQLAMVQKNSIVVAHQGLQGSSSGDYFQDKSAITSDDVKDFRVISGHYHTRQDIKTGRPRQGAVGLWSYVGNPYTINFGEANDPDKGFQVLMSDGTLEFVPTNLRKHVVAELEGAYPHNLIKGPNFDSIKDDDIVLVRVVGTPEQLTGVTKDLFFKKIASKHVRLELLPVTTKVNDNVSKALSNPELLDHIIDNSNNSDACKTRLKQTWRQLC